MDEAMRRICEPLAPLQGLPPGAVMTEAKRLARKAVKEQYRARGLKPARRAMGPLAERIWREKASESAKDAPFEATSGRDNVSGKINALERRARRKARSRRGRCRSSPT